MGLIIDTGVFIAAERRNVRVPSLFRTLQQRFVEEAMDISVITLSELTHGIYRAQSADMANRRRQYVEEIEEVFAAHPVDSSLARLIGRIEGEQAAIGNTIALPDLIIGATAFPSASPSSPLTVSISTASLGSLSSRYRRTAGCGCRVPHVSLLRHGLLRANSPQPMSSPRSNPKPPKPLPCNHIHPARIWRRVSPNSLNWKCKYKAAAKPARAKLRLSRRRQKEPRPCEHHPRQGEKLATAE